jgi:hypothetical protein
MCDICFFCFSYKWAIIFFFHNNEKFETRLSLILAFILVGGISKSIMEARRGRSLQRIWVGDYEYPTHLLFVDDVLLFFQWYRGRK